MQRLLRGGVDFAKGAEEYFSRHLNADLSHTVCPDSIKHQYPELADPNAFRTATQGPGARP